MKSKFFIYVLPLILVTVGMVLMLRIPSGSQKRGKKEAVTTVPLPAIQPEPQSEGPMQPEEPNLDKDDSKQPMEMETADKAEEPQKALTEDEMRRVFLNRAEQISPNGLWLEFAKRDDALLRCVKAVDAVAVGKCPVEAFDFLKPTTPFSAIKNAAGLLIISAEAIARYQAPADVVASIDAKAAADLFTELEPALDTMFHTLGYPESVTFRDKLTEACTVILETPLLKGEAELEHVAGQLYKYANPQLEELQPVQKLLLRLGEQNREEIRRKATDFSTILKLYAE